MQGRVHPFPFGRIRYSGKQFMLSGKQCPFGFGNSHANFALVRFEQGLQVEITQA